MKIPIHERGKCPSIRGQMVKSSHAYKFINKTGGHGELHNSNRNPFIVKDLFIKKLFHFTGKINIFMNKNYTKIFPKKSKFL